MHSCSTLKIPPASGSVQVTWDSWDALDESRLASNMLCTYKNMPYWLCMDLNIYVLSVAAYNVCVFSRLEWQKNCGFTQLIKQWMWCWCWCIRRFVYNLICPKCMHVVRLCCVWIGEMDYLIVNEISCGMMMMMWVV